MPADALTIVAIELSPAAARTATWRVWRADGRAFSRAYVGPRHDDPAHACRVFAVRPASFRPLV